jgi:PGF-pre-PGF domain-containing protein
MWSLVEKVKAGAILEGIPTEVTGEIISLVPEDRLIDRLPEMSAAKLWEVPLELLMENLPSVPVMHLDFWNRPQVPGDLPDPVASQVSQSVTEYALPEARENEWAVLVSSPAPVDRIWARFTRPLTNVQIEFELLDGQPADTTALPPGRIANSFFRVSLVNARATDVSVAAALISVETSWLEANLVNKWSIEFNQFSEELNTWVPSPSKRVREDEERVTFAVVVPSFSALAITGAVELPEQVFSVTGLGISPESPRAGEHVTVSANVTNTSMQRAVYPAKLWLNNSVEDAQNVVVEPGQTVPFTFAVRKPAGAYKVRVERLLGELDVSPAKQAVVAPPSVGAAVPDGWLLAMLMLFGAGLIMAGVAIIRRSRSGGRQPRAQ